MTTRLVDWMRAWICTCHWSGTVTSRAEMAALAQSTPSTRLPRSTELTRLPRLNALTRLYALTWLRPRLIGERFAARAFGAAGPFSVYSP